MKYFVLGLSILGSAIAQDVTYQLVNQDYCTQNGITDMAQCTCASFNAIKLTEAQCSAARQTLGGPGTMYDPDYNEGTFLPGCSFYGTEYYFNAETDLQHGTDGSNANKCAHGHPYYSCICIAGAGGDAGGDAETNQGDDAGAAGPCTDPDVTPADYINAQCCGC